MFLPIGVLGVGAMGSALIRGFLKEKVVPADKIIAYDLDKERLDDIQKELQVATALSIGEVLNSSKTLLLCVKPQQLETALLECQKAMQNQLILSIAAGIKLSFYEKFFPEHAIIRIMPNTPAQVGEGVSALALNAQVTTEQKQFALKLFQSVGKARIVAEKFMDAITALSGSGPGFVAYILEGFIEGGVLCGLSKELSQELIFQTVKGTIKLLEEKNLSPSQLKALVSSPAGTTIAGLLLLEEQGVKGSLMEALHKAKRRSQELSA